MRYGTDTRDSDARAASARETFADAPGARLRAHGPTARGTAGDNPDARRTAGEGPSAREAPAARPGATARSADPGSRLCRALNQVLLSLNQVVLGKEQTVRHVLAVLVAGGHVLLEDVPGVGKTTLAVALARLTGLSWRRVQFTPDVLPSDLTGFTLYRRETGDFAYQPGALACNLLLADELNRTSPKTQAALLEAMEERQVTVDGVTRPLPEPFFVVATQNPLGAEGTQPLPHAEADRFMASLSLGYPDRASEMELARSDRLAGRAAGLEAVVGPGEIAEAQRAAEQIFVHQTLLGYAVDLVRATRRAVPGLLALGASPRASIDIVRMARAAAWLAGRDYVVPADVADVFVAAVRHRVVLGPKARAEGLDAEAVLGQVLAAVPVPAPGSKAAAPHGREGRAADAPAALGDNRVGGRAPGGTESPGDTGRVGRRSSRPRRL